MRILSSLLLCMTCVVARGHEFWIEPAPYHADTGTTVSLGLYVGQDFFGEPQAYLPRRVVRFTVTGPGGDEAIESEFAEAPAGRFTPARNGLYVAVYQGTPITKEFPAHTFEKYLAFTGLEHISAIRARNGQTGNPGRERYSRFAKSYVRIGAEYDAARYRQPMGLGIELVPLADPNTINAGDELPMRVLYAGKGLESITVIGYPSSSPKDIIRVRTDSDGIARLPVAAAGAWLFNAVHMIPGDGRKFDWESFWASVTLQLGSGDH